MQTPKVGHSKLTYAENKQVEAAIRAHWTRRGYAVGYKDQRIAAEVHRLPGLQGVTYLNVAYVRQQCGLHTGERKVLVQTLTQEMVNRLESLLETKGRAVVTKSQVATVEGYLVHMERGKALHTRRRFQAQPVKKAPAQAQSP